MNVHRIRVGAPSLRAASVTLAGCLSLGLAWGLAPLSPSHAAAPAGPTTAAADPSDPEGGYGRLMLLMDASGSMKESAGGGQTKIQAAKQALKTVVKALPDDAEVGLRVFGATEVGTTNPKACGDTQLVVAPGTGNRDDLLKAIKGYQPFGETPIPIALRKAAKDLGNKGARSIVLVSDGESTCKPEACDVAAKLVNKGIDLQIDVVGLSVSGEARKQLKCIAEQGHGTYYDADDADDIEKRLTRAAQRALRPFTLVGEPIKGGEPSSATPITVGDWIDEVNGRDAKGSTKSYLFTRTVPGTTLRATAVTQGRIGWDGLAIEITDADGETCDQADALRLLDARNIVGVQAVASVDNGCGAAGDYLVTVERKVGQGDPIPFGLRISEEPVLTDPGFTSTEATPQIAEPNVSGRPSSVVGGSAFPNATPLESGSYSSTVVPGEAVLFSVFLDYGQSARISVDFPEGSSALKQEVTYFPPLTRLELYNPMQARLDEPPGAVVQENTGWDPASLLTATPQVSRAWLEDRGDPDYSMAGDYYLALSLARKDYALEFPFTINIEVVGEPQPGPTYAEGATWSVADGASSLGGDPAGTPTDDPTSEEPTSPTTPGSEAGSDDDAADSDDATKSDGGTGAALGWAAGGAGLVAVLGALALWLRRSRSVLP